MSFKTKKETRLVDAHYPEEYYYTISRIIAFMEVLSTPANLTQWICMLNDCIKDMVVIDDTIAGKRLKAVIVDLITREQYNYSQTVQLLAGVENIDEIIDCVKSHWLTHQDSHTRIEAVKFMAKVLREKPAAECSVYLLSLLKLEQNEEVRLQIVSEIADLAEKDGDYIGKSMKELFEISPVDIRNKILDFYVNWGTPAAGIYLTQNSRDCLTDTRLKSADELESELWIKCRVSDSLLAIFCKLAKSAKED